MGEPLHNEDALAHGECFHHAPSQISVSTVGIPATMLRFARGYPRVRLALSLHSARESVRRQLIPLARRTSLAEWVADLPVHINLIPHDPIADAPKLRSTPRPAREAFGNALKAKGITVTLRYSLGADVTAACGQLVCDENQRARAT